MSFAKAIQNFDAPATKLPAGRGLPSMAFKGVTRFNFVVPIYTGASTEFYTIIIAPTSANDIVSFLHGALPSGTSHFDLAPTNGYQPGLLFSNGNYGTGLSSRPSILKARLSNTTAVLTRQGVFFGGVAPHGTSVGDIDSNQLSSYPWCSVYDSSRKHAELTWLNQKADEWMDTATSQDYCIAFTIPCVGTAQTYMLELAQHIEYAGYKVSGTTSTVSNNKYYSFVSGIMDDSANTLTEATTKHAVSLLGKLLAGYGALTSARNAIRGLQNNEL
jgi:hypothetical protein